MGKGDSRPQITVFGGSKPQEGSPPYQQAQKLGRLLAEAGYAVATGGYIGTMEAVSRGASQAGGHVIGITCNEIESWRPVGPNTWIDEERRFQTVRERLYALIESCQAAVALPGGIGTLAEIAVMWSELQTGAIQPRPLILVGDGWRTTISTLYGELGPYIAEKDRKLLLFAPTVEEAAQELHAKVT